ncbi:MAG: hypothetical protein OK422_05640 [Thaumarchaeota archaeon]|nr:hypothetical protein [Nitrososphaerota archaeon]
MDLAVIFSVINAGLLLYFISLYVGIYRDRKAMYTLGLAAFAALMLFQNALTAFSYATMTGYFGEAVLPFLFTMSILQFGALAILLRVSI